MRKRGAGLRNRYAWWSLSRPAVPRTSRCARSPSLPEVPTYAEAGLKDLVLEQWPGLFFHAGTPAEAIARLNAEVNRGLAEGQVRERYAQNGLEPVGGTVEQFARQYRDDYDKYAQLIRELAIKPDLSTPSSSVRVRHGAGFFSLASWNRTFTVQVP